MRLSLLLLIPALAFGQDLATLEAHRKEVSAALRAKDYAMAAEKQRLVTGAMTHSSAQAYRLAEIEALAGHRDQALEALDRYLLMGGAQDPAEDESFASLKDDTAFAALQTRAKANGRPVRNSAKRLDLPPQDLITEDIAWDGARKHLLVSSVHRRKILSVGLDGHAEDFLGLLDPDLGGIFALGLDMKRDRLWMATAWLEQVGGFTKDQEGHSALLCFRLSDRKLLERVDAPADGRPHALGDMTVAPDGEVFVSDGRGCLYRHRFGGGGLKEIAPGHFRSPQTPALDADGHHLFVGDYSLGLARVDLRTEEVRWVEAPDSLATEGMDGLYLRGGKLIAVQNGTVPARVVQMELSKDHQRVLRWRALDTGDLPEPTHGTFVDGAFCYLSGAGWERFDDAGALRKDAPPDAPTIRRIPAVKLKAWPTPSTSRPASASLAKPSR
jgi:sugar lactone lactonase YvrE